MVYATEVNATLLYGKFDIEGLFVELRLPFSPIVPLIKKRDSFDGCFHIMGIWLLGAGLRSPNHKPL